MMSFVSLGGDDSTKPTYFEVVAADRLVPSLRAAAVYTLSVRARVCTSVHLLELASLQSAAHRWWCVDEWFGFRGLGLFGSTVALCRMHNPCVTYDAGIC